MNLAVNPGLESSIADHEIYKRTLDHFRKLSIRLPGITQLANPKSFSDSLLHELAEVDPDAADARNLYRVHWYNNESRRGIADVPGHIVLPAALTGVDAKIVVIFGNRFPMIGAHKVLAAYGCLVPRLVSGAFDPTHHRAVWPSTGNYCRGGVAISRILGCRGVAVLPEGMSQERFRWLEAWVKEPNDIIRTFGSESNVKEIYDTCHELAQVSDNIIFNQFNEFGNYVIHRAVTGPALEHVFNYVNNDNTLTLHAFVAAAGSAGTLAAGDYLKKTQGSRVGVIEALECPTLLYNGYGEHNIQGIGDKHVPFIHNVMSMDFAIGVTDAASDALIVLFNTDAGRRFLNRRTGLDDSVIGSLQNLGLSSIANVIGAIKYAKYNKLSAKDAIITIATDGAEMYNSEIDKTLSQVYSNNFDETAAAEVYGRYLLGVACDHTLELTRADRERMFNLGYYTWVEQQGISIDDFDARRNPHFWEDLTDVVPKWDEMIAEMNAAIEI